MSSFETNDISPFDDIEESDASDESDVPVCISSSALLCSVEGLGDACETANLFLAKLASKESAECSFSTWSAGKYTSLFSLAAESWTL